MKDIYRTRAHWHVHDALRGLMKKANKYNRYPSFEKWGLNRQLHHAQACLTYLEFAMTLDHFWDSVQEDKEWYQERLKTIALEMLRTSTMRDDDDGLEEELLNTNPSKYRWSQIFERLNMNQLRTIDLPNWSQTSFNKSYKDNGIDN
jgi:hypothetical protein